jgi:hypothetical protein
VTYIELIVRHLETSGADQFLIALVEEYLKHDHPTSESPWQSGHDAIIRKALDYGNSKRFHLRRFQTRLNVGQRNCALQHGQDTKKAKRLMVERLKQLEKLICRPS